MTYPLNMTKPVVKVQMLIRYLFMISIFMGSVYCSSTAIAQEQVQKRSVWIADNGNGTFTNPLFYEEFSDPDLIRVDDDYYLTGTTMHAMPGLPVLYSKDLVNWKLLTYACPELDLGPAYRLQDGKDIYGQGIWAPCLRYHKGRFYIFTNVNGQSTQLFTASRPEGPWKRTSMKKAFHDLSVLFDDDGKVYVVWGYQELHLAELDTALTDIVPGTEKIIVQKGSGAGEGCHMYKINNKYYITNTNYDPVCYQVCLRADKPEGPYEVNLMSTQEALGVGTGWRLGDTRNGPPFQLKAPVPDYIGCIPMHQGGIVQTRSGEWWGWSMMDHNSIGRVTCLSPVTWDKGWPYFGLEGNLTRSPRTWVKPDVGVDGPVRSAVTFEHSDDFAKAKLAPVWQWNHLPDDTKWSLTERKGYLRLHSLPASDLFRARNSLTQRAVGPASVATTRLDTDGLQAGDIAGLGILNLPYAWLGVQRSKRSVLKFYEQQTSTSDSVVLKQGQKRIWLRVYGNFDTDTAMFSYSLNGKEFNTIGNPVVMPYQLRTFQGVRYSLFNFNISNRSGGHADFDDLKVDQLPAYALNRTIPLGNTIRLTSLADSTVMVNWNGILRPVDAQDALARGNASLFQVVDKGKGRIALRSVADGGYVTVIGNGRMAQVTIRPDGSGVGALFQWQDMLRNDLMLLSLATDRYLFAAPYAKSLCSADAPGTRPDRRDGACYKWTIVKVAEKTIKINFR